VFAESARRTQKKRIADARNVIARPAASLAGGGTA